MILYEYYCSNCEDTVEISHRMNDTPTIVCNACYKVRVKKLTLGGTIFKGTGWGKDR